MHFSNAIHLLIPARLLSAAVIVLSLLIGACGGSSGGSQVGNQKDQTPPIAVGSVLGKMPIGDAKTFSTRANNEVILTAKDSHGPDAPILSFEWKQIGGESVSLTKRNADTVTLTTPNVRTTTELRFQVTVVDSNNKTATDIITLKVQPSGDVDQFLSNPQAPQARLSVLAALQGGTDTGTIDQPFTLKATTIAHWRNRLGAMDQVEVFSETLSSQFPAGFAPASDYFPLTEGKNPRLLFKLHPLDIDEINQHPLSTSNYLHYILMAALFTARAF
jgi:hypothetical protein